MTRNHIFSESAHLSDGVTNINDLREAARLQRLSSLVSHIGAGFITGVGMLYAYKSFSENNNIAGYIAAGFSALGAGILEYIGYQNRQWANSINSQIKEQQREARQ